MLSTMFYVMGIMLCTGLFAKLISSVTARKMVREAAEIQKSNHRFMKLVKAKFEHASLISDRVQNVSAFVDKYMYEYKVMGIRLNTWRNIPKKMLLLITVLGFFSVCESIRLGEEIQSIVGKLQWTGLLIFALAFLNFMSAEEMQLQAAKNYIVEYLENVCIYRYAKKYEKEAEEVTAEDEITEKLEEVEEETAPPLVQEVETVSEEERRSQQEMRIRAILEEFLA